MLKFQADIINTPVFRPDCVETTALGAAYLAGLATGYWTNLDDIRQNWALEDVFMPTMKADKRAELKRGWEKAVKCALIWTEV